MTSERLARRSIEVGATSISVGGSGCKNRANVSSQHFDREEFLLAVVVMAEAIGLFRADWPGLFQEIDAARSGLALQSMRSDDAVVTS